MLRFMVVMVPLVFVINGLTKGNWDEAFFFAIAVAVGLTPEMLPMIVTVCLSKGAHRDVAARRSSSSGSERDPEPRRDGRALHRQDRHADDGPGHPRDGTATWCCKEDEDVLALAYLNSHFQTGLKNVLDRAVLAHTESHARPRAIPEYAKVDEIPFDFQRRIMSVVVRTPDGKDRIICKGAPEAIFTRCSELRARTAQLYPMDHLLIDGPSSRSTSSSAPTASASSRSRTRRRAAPTSARLLARTTRCDLILNGYVAFLDPPKDTAGPAIAALQAARRAVKVLTGDNDLVSPQDLHARSACPPTHVLLGSRGRDDDRRSSSPRRRSRTTLFAAALAGAQAAHHHGPAGARATSSASWATASTTPRPCAPPTWASPSTPPSTSPRSRPT